jgi:hypothetical protein
VPGSCRAPKAGVSALHCASGRAAVARCCVVIVTEIGDIYLCPESFAVTTKLVACIPKALGNSTVAVVVVAAGVTHLNGTCRAASISDIGVSIVA